jgi:hypothetical protein
MLATTLSLVKPFCMFKGKFSCLGCTATLHKCNQQASYTFDSNGEEDKVLNSVTHFAQQQLELVAPMHVSNPYQSMKQHASHPTINQRKKNEKKKKK